jgi:hypothetical protein
MFTEWDPVGEAARIDAFSATDTGSVLLPAEHGPIHPKIASIAFRLKKKHPTIYMLQIDQELVVFIRPLTKGEWETLVNLRHIIPNLDRTDALSDALLWPKELLTDSSIPAGWVEAVFDEIEEMSGFGDPDNLVYTYRQFGSLLEGEMADLDAQIKMLLPAAFRNLTPQDIQNWDIISLAEGLAIVEKFLKKDLELKTTAEVEKEKTKGSRIASQVHTQEELRKMREVL